MKFNSVGAIAGSNLTAPTSTEVVVHRSKLLSIIALVSLVIFAIMALGPMRSSAYGASAPAVNQCNGTDNVGGEEVACSVTVTNKPLASLAPLSRSKSVTGRQTRPPRARTPPHLQVNSSPR